jgi:hypothetical protein
MLSDACADFVSLHVRKKWSITEGATCLAKDIEHYSQSPVGYPAYQLDALRLAVRHVIAKPDDDQAVLWLLCLAECVRKYYDSDLCLLHPPSLRVKEWCDRYLACLDGMIAQTKIDEIKAQSQMKIDEIKAQMKRRRRGASAA